MTTGERYFLAVAQEQGVSRAAKALFVTQQSLSEQMGRLEERYGQLFVRRPRFRLTPAGELLLDTLRQISVLEDRLENQLSELRARPAGRLRVGMRALRARLLLPEVVESFSRLYPGVTLSFLDDDTVVLEELLRCGELELFLGVDARDSPEFLYQPVADEPIYLLAASALLERLPDGVPKSGLSLPELCQLPLIFQRPRSNFQQKIDRFFADAGATPKAQIYITDFEVQLSLVQRGVGACFCPGLLLRRVAELNRAGATIDVLSVRGLEATSALSLVTHRRGYCPEYLGVFSELLQKALLAALSEKV